MKKDAVQCADDMLKKIENCIDGKMKTIPQLQSAVVSEVNPNGTVNVFFPPDNTNIFKNIPNQSIYQDIKAGDSVELMLKNGSYNNCWVVAKHAATPIKKEPTLTKADVLDLLKELKLI